MKNIIIISLFSLLLVCCKNDSKTKVNSEENIEENEMLVSETESKVSYPSRLNAVFDAHGGIENWSKMNNLCFEMDGRNGVETHTISLGDRRAKIQTKNWSIGYDGTDVWLLQNTEEAYKGNARFYHNLMFYFYAMPFVLGDEGINYELVPSTQLNGENFEGIKISYEAGVGDAPKDEYILYFNPETNIMEWLAYTVTYTSGEESDDWHFINYSKWGEVNGLLLPKELTWFEVENGKPTKARNSRKFEKITATETILEASVFAKPEDAVISER